jgi:hypothetical protein
MQMKEMSIARATALVQRRLDPAAGGPISEAEEAFEDALDATGVLRRVGRASSVQEQRLVELRCDIEYGPLRATEGDMRRHLERQLRAVASSMRAADFAVFDLVVTPLTPEQLDAIIGDLASQANDIALPLRTRKHLATTVSKLRRGGEAARVPRRPKGVESAAAS